MSARTLNSRFFAVTLAALALRALAPDGYMPAAPGSGLLYELCPSGMPDEIVQAQSRHGGDHGHHGSHHHGSHGDDEDTQASADKQCPIGHMLASAIAFDVTPADEFAPGAELLVVEAPLATWRRHDTGYRSRAPPV